MQTNPSPYMLIFHDLSPDSYKTMSPEQAERLVKKWIDWYDDLEARGKAEHGRPLEPEGRLVSGARGERVVDGPFAESKEAIIGYFLLMVGSLDEATEIAQQCPGLPYGVTVEVRPVAANCRVGPPANRISAQKLTSAQRNYAGVRI
jgi:hypothetical protein